MAFATLEGIRNRIATIVTALVPTSLAGDRFQQSRDEGKADFRTLAESSPQGSLRRFQVDDTGEDDLPQVSNVDSAQLLARFTLIIAYPQTHRYGGNAYRDRKDVIDEDWRKINLAIGIYGRANFSAGNDCTPMGCRKEVEKGNAGVDFLIVRFEALYYLDVDA